MRFTLAGKMLRQGRFPLREESKVDKVEGVHGARMRKACQGGKGPRAIKRKDCITEHISKMSSKESQPQINEMQSKGRLTSTERIEH